MFYKNDSFDYCFDERNNLRYKCSESITPLLDNHQIFEWQSWQPTQTCKRYFTGNKYCYMYISAFRSADFYKQQLTAPCIILRIQGTCETLQDVHLLLFSRYKIAGKHASFHLGTFQFWPVSGTGMLELQKMHKSKKFPGS